MPAGPIRRRPSTSPSLDINFTVPGDDNFRFTPPKGATVEGAVTAVWASAAASARPPRPLNPQIIGTGWTSILAVHAGDLVPGAGSNPAAGRSARQFLDALTPVSGAWGSGRLFESKLVSILFTDDGRVFVGAVDPSALYAAAATHK